MFRRSKQPTTEELIAARYQADADGRARQRAEDAAQDRRDRDWEARIWELRARCPRGPDDDAHDNCYGH